MNRWFRWYEGTVEDGKLRMIAQTANVTVATVTGTWACLLEDASNAHNDSNGKQRGHAVRGSTFYSVILGLDLDCIDAILRAMENAGLIIIKPDVIEITKWKERQFQADQTDPTNAERQRRWRVKHRKQNQTLSNSGVTAAKLPDTDTDNRIQKQNTETEKKKERTLPSVARRALEFLKEGAPEDQFWHIVPQLEAHFGVSRGRAVQLAKLNDGFEVTVQQLRDVARANNPAAYLGAIIKKLQAELAPPSIIAGAADEPAWLREKRSWGERMSVTRLESGQWRVDGQIYDNDGRLVGW